MSLITRSLTSVALGVVVTAASACGGPQEASSPAEATGGSGGRFASGAGSMAAAPPSRCEDGTCAECGEGICPTGFFCDESDSVAVCSWLPACAGEPTCECVTPRLDEGCDCESRDGGIYVACR